MELTEEDIQKIALYVPFKVRFAPSDEKQSAWTRFKAKGIIGSVIIERWDEEDREILDSSDIGHAGNTDLPILRRFDKMEDEEFREFEKLTAKGSQMTKFIQFTLYPDVFFYALSNHFDIFGLIDQGKAIDMDAK